MLQEEVKVTREAIKVSKGGKFRAYEGILLPTIIMIYQILFIGIVYDKDYKLRYFTYEIGESRK